MTGTTALTFWGAVHNGMLSWGYDSNGSQQRGVTVGRRADCVSAAGFRHGDGESRIDLGGLPPLPAGLTPVWERLGGRIHRAPLPAAPR